MVKSKVKKNNMNSEIIKAKSYKEAKAIYRTLDNKVCLKILEILDRDGAKSVIYLSEKLKLVYAVVSMHLSVLRKSNIVTAVVGQDTRQRLYSINRAVLVNYNELTKKLLETEQLAG